jgi:hypothetical protein
MQVNEAELRCVLERSVGDYPGGGFVAATFLFWPGVMIA